jgi:hypothetical protein
VTLEHHRLGILECLRAIREVYRREVKDALFLRALTYFDDAEREAPLPGEGPGDWEAVKDYFAMNAGSLLIPPGSRLEIQARVVDVAAGSDQARETP